MEKRRADNSVERDIDAQCDRFEGLLKAGEQPNIDDFLRDVPTAGRSMLALELLRLAVEYTGTRPTRTAATQEGSNSRPLEHGTGPSLFGAASQIDVSPASPLVGAEEIESAETERLTIVGSYELLGAIGSGGMGTVYRARHRGLKRLVALKILHPERWQGLADAQRRQALQRFVREACAAAHHEHPNIVTVYEGGSWEDVQFLAMQLVEGKSLAAIVQEAPLDNRRAAAYMEAICRGLHAAHVAGVVHRDLKPSNILVETATDRPLLTDFGLAKVLDSDCELTLSGEVFGSPPVHAARAGAQCKPGICRSRHLWHWRNALPPVDRKTPVPSADRSRHVASSPQYASRSSPAAQFSRGPRY